MSASAREPLLASSAAAALDDGDNEQQSSTRVDPYLASRDVAQQDDGLGSGGADGVVRKHVHSRLVSLDLFRGLIVAIMAW